jgi:hypothetical protein
MIEQADTITEQDDITPPRIRFATKIAIVLRGDLADWQKLNVASFLSGGLAGAFPEIVGEPYCDGDGSRYSPLIRQPILVFTASGEELRRTLQRARERDLLAAIYTTALFATGNDIDNRAAVAAVPYEDLDLAGVGLHAPRNLVDRICKGLALHR